MKKAFILLLVLLLAAVVWLGSVRPLTAADSAVVYVDRDDTADSVCRKVGEWMNTPQRWVFSCLVSATDYGQHVRTGRYRLQGKSMLAAFRMLRNGMQEPVALVVPSVRTMEDLSGVLGERLMVDSAEWAAAFKSTDVCKQLGYDTATIACLIVPNTYDIYWNTSVEKFLARMKKENKAFWNDERRAKAEAVGLTPEEVVTLASIVDEETANNGEKPAVAGMYINRLRKPMPLQADPTVKFALRQFGLRRIYHKQLMTESPYNTYRNLGLPPGPIRIPSVAGIDAVLNYVRHDYLYMCAKADFSGTHQFAVTYDEHLKNAARYAAALNERNIR